jgi:hypothetical protein
MFGRRNTIENHYQSSKVFEDGQIPADWRRAREIKRSGLRQVGWKIGPRLLETRQDPRDPSRFAVEDFGIQLYCLLWCKYVRLHPELVEHARRFDAFADPFAGNFPFSQARVWELVAKEPHGLDRLARMGSELAALLRESQG